MPGSIPTPVRFTCGRLEGTAWAHLAVGPLGMRLPLSPRAGATGLVMLPSLPQPPTIGRALAQGPLDSCMWAHLSPWQDTPRPSLALLLTCCVTSEEPCPSSSPCPHLGNG